MANEQHKRHEGPNSYRETEGQERGGTGRNRPSNYGGSIRTDQPAATAELEGYFGGVDFPVDKRELMRQVGELEASQAVMALLQRLPDRHYASPQDVNAALEMLGEQ